MKNVFDDIREASEAKESRVEVIGFGRRLLAMLIDGFFVMFVSFIIAMLIGMIDVFFGGGLLSWNLVIIVVMFLFSFFYYTGKWVRNSGQTLGKLLLNIRVVSADGTPLTTGKVLLRYFGYIVSGAVVSLGFIWVSFDKRRRGWHDMIAKTYVIHIRDDIPTEGEVIFIPSDAGKGWIWPVLWVLLAIFFPATIFAGLWFLGPMVNAFLNGLR
jgi:uncharacterized RDD family membrane protein YckC